MQTVSFRGLQPTVLGFGCGAVLGRVGKADSLRAMGEAWDQGITLFDTARSYGYGEAEGLLGEFLRGRRDRATIFTKFGILPPQKSLLKTVAKPIVRGLLQVLPGVRGAVRKVAGSEVAPDQFTVAVLRASLEESLRQLKTDHVDVLFLHSAPASALQQDDVLAELQLFVDAGKVRVAGISAEVDVLRQALPMPVFGSMQTAANVFDLGVTELTRAHAGEHLFVANHPFGGVTRVEESKARLAALATDTTLDATLREKLRSGDINRLLAEVVFGLVLRGTGIHTVVPAMMRPENIRTNAAAVTASRFSNDEVTLLRERMQAGV
jgi:aryl-alcohol dehydrogenase-like predicted oxidoreductase